MEFAKHYFRDTAACRENSSRQTPGELGRELAEHQSAHHQKQSQEKRYFIYLISEAAFHNISVLKM